MRLRETGGYSSASSLSGSTPVGATKLSAHSQLGSRIARFTACVGILLAPGGGIAAAPGVESAVSIKTLNPGQLAQQPDSKRIIVGRGTATTMGMLRAFHAAHLRSFAQAAALGKNAAIELKTGNAYGVHRDSPAQSAASRVAMLLTVPEAPETLQKYAKDYQDYCTAAAATACIYLPAGLGYPNGTMISQDNTVVAPDYLITDPTVCASQGGKISYPGLVDQKVCVYTYPLRVVTQFVWSNNSYAAHCPSTDWHIIVDHHGAALAELAAFGPTHLWDPNVTTPLVHCVVQVFGP